MGVKIDANPGRLNQVQLNSFFKTEKAIDLSTAYFGQCSEFCGIGHGFMPIVVVSSHLYDHFELMLTTFIKEKALTIEEGMFGSYPSFIYDKSESLLGNNTLTVPELAKNNAPDSTV